MKQPNTPWSKSYQELKMARRREQSRSEEQKAKTKQWGDGFHITSEAKEANTHLPGAVKLCGNRRQVDDIIEERRTADSLKEVWDD